jgi:hypothetical protein
VVEVEEATLVMELQELQIQVAVAADVMGMDILQVQAVQVSSLFLLFRHRTRPLLKRQDLQQVGT